MSPVEVAAFVVSVIGVWLTARRSLWNFPFSLLSVALYGLIFYRVRLYADMTLQGIFAASLLYGLWQWSHSRQAGGEVQVAKVTRAEVSLSVILGVVTVGALGLLLSTRTDASFPWIDSSLLAGSLVASVWAARRRVESWWVWIVVDTLYVGLYVVKALYLTAALYAAFVVLAVVGLRRWHVAFVRQTERVARSLPVASAPAGSAS